MNSLIFNNFSGELPVWYLLVSFTIIKNRDGILKVAADSGEPGSLDQIIYKPRTTERGIEFPLILTLLREAAILIAGRPPLWHRARQPAQNYILSLSRKIRE